ncbi:hypothetical protein ACQPYK_25850 [Streptosporangium sp. CA-135522]|uniref:hypothetical protein n=1 Tax=Streptosporangium sp. CA-135522 TaxID=3240072 RepID=UPI003D93A10C
MKERSKIDARFELARDHYGNDPEGPGGRSEAYSGLEINWMVHSWLAIRVPSSPTCI